MQIRRDVVWDRRTYHLGALLTHIPLHRHRHGSIVRAHASTGDTLAPRRLAGVMLMTVGHAKVLVRLGGRARISSGDLSLLFRRRPWQVETKRQ